MDVPWRARSLAGILLAAVLAACARERDPVRSTLQEMTAAAESRDAERFVRALSPSYRGPDGEGRDETRLTLFRLFAAYERLGVAIRDLSVERSASAAHAAFRADVIGVPRKISGLEGLLPRSSSWRFEFRLVPEEGVWKVASAVWRRVEE